MSISEEEQMKAMLAEMGMDSIDELDSIEGEEKGFRPIPEGPVSRKSSTSSEEISSEEVQNELPQQAGEVLGSEINQVLNNIEVSEVADEKVVSATEPRASGQQQHRELSVSALLHLMGLPTGSQFTVLDTKLDLALTKMATLQAKIDRINSQFELLSATTGTERLEFQVSEIRSIMKKFFPQAFTGGSVQTSQSKMSAVKAPVVVPSSEPLSSSSSDKAEQRKETSVHVDVAAAGAEEEEEPMTDEDYQVLESQKLRDQTKKDTKKG